MYLGVRMLTRNGVADDFILSGNISNRLSRPYGDFMIIFLFPNGIGFLEIDEVDFIYAGRRAP